MYLMCSELIFLIFWVRFFVYLCECMWKVGEMIDLTHPVNDETIAWPSATAFSSKQVKMYSLIENDFIFLRLNVKFPESSFFGKI